MKVAGVEWQYEAYMLFQLSQSGAGKIEFKRGDGGAQDFFYRPVPTPDPPLWAEGQAKGTLSVQNRFECRVNVAGDGLYDRLTYSCAKLHRT